MSTRQPSRTRERIDERWQVSPRRPDGSRGTAGPHLGRIRLTPIRVTLGIALVGSLVFAIYAITVRDASQIPLLATGALVLGLVFAALAVAGAVSTYRAASEGRSGAAFAQALLGGAAAIVAFGCLAIAVILALVWHPPTA
ncbi:MAG TPA: hypothetical protein VEY67_03070 [Candidatus Dormibacteraeota bacterium]|nr:hypothetical protein [Candidatus Dormibacteraeota bacterium]